MAYSSTTERAAVSEQLIVNAILPGLHGVKPNRGRDGWSFHCPLDHRKQNAPAAIWVNDDGWIRSIASIVAATTSCGNSW